MNRLKILRSITIRKNKIYEPNNFDKNFAFKTDEVKQWKQIRANEVASFFSKKYTSFNDLKNAVSPLLWENKTIYENYYLNENKDLWNKFEPKILINNRKLNQILSILNKESELPLDLTILSVTEEKEIEF